MNEAVLKLFKALVLFGALGGHGHSALAEGPIELPTDSGRYSLAQYEDKVVLLDFWASWCGPCRQSFPWMNSLKERFGEEGLVIIGVNLDAEHSDAEGFLKEVPAEFQILFDASGASAEQMQVQGMPMSYLIDRKGRVREKLVGFSPSRAAHHEDKIKSLLAELAL